MTDNLPRQRRYFINANRLANTAGDGFVSLLLLPIKQAVILHLVNWLVV